MNSTPKGSPRVTLSMVAALAGWAAGLVYYFANPLREGGESSTYAFSVVAMWSGLVVIAAWLIFFLPLVLIVPPKSNILRPAFFVPLGAVLGLLAFQVLVAWWAPLWEYWFFALYPAVVGAASAATYWLLSRRNHQA